MMNPSPQTGQRLTLSALYASREEAERARLRLQALSLPQDGLHVIYRAGDHDPQDSASDLGRLSLPEKDEQLFAEALRRGCALVAVTAVTPDQAGPVRAALEEGALDVDDKAAEWRVEGWSGQHDGQILPDGVRGTTRDASYTNPRTGNGSDLLDESYEGPSVLAGVPGSAAEEPRGHVRSYSGRDPSKG